MLKNVFGLLRPEDIHILQLGALQISQSSGCCCSCMFMRCDRLWLETAIIIWKLIFLVPFYSQPAMCCCLAELVTRNDSFVSHISVAEADILARRYRLLWTECSSAASVSKKKQTISIVAQDRKIYSNNIIMK